MRIKSLTMSLMLTSLLMLAACGDNDSAEPVADESAGDVLFRFTIGVSSHEPASISRANSFGHENGRWHENEINSALILVYDQPLNSSTGNIVRKFFFAGADITETEGYTPTGYNVRFYYDGVNHDIRTDMTQVNEYTLEGYANDLADGDYYVIAFANIGDLPEISADAAGFAALKNYVYKGDLYTDPGAAPITHATNFAMAAVDEHKFRFNRSAVSDNTFDVTAADVNESATRAQRTLHVQRLAARIDISFGTQGELFTELWDEGINVVFGHDDDDNTAHFPIYDSTTGKKIYGAQFILEDFTILNGITEAAGMYLLERNLRYGTEFLFGQENWLDTGYAQFNILSPTSKSVANIGPFGAKSTAINGHLVANGVDFAALAYVRENTFASYNASNAYTGVCLKGRTNLARDHFDGTVNGDYNDDVDDSYVAVQTQFNIRHCYPSSGLDTSKPLAYGIVRNTIYRVQIKFFATGESLSVRYYYYGTNFDGKDGKSEDAPMTQQDYDEAKFYEYILESDGTAPND